MRTQRKLPRHSFLCLMFITLLALALPCAALAGKWSYATATPTIGATGANAATVSPSVTPIPAAQSIRIPAIIPVADATSRPAAATPSPAAITVGPNPTPAATASAAAANAARMVEAPLFMQNQALTQPRNTVSYRFLLPAGTVLGEDATLTLHMTASSTLIDERSTLTLALNGETLQTLRLLSIANAEGGLWKTTLPRQAIRTDGVDNVLTIITVQRSTEGDAQDIGNPSNWVKLLADSTLRLTLAGDGPLTLSTLYETFFNGIENQSALAACFVLDDPARGATLASLLRLSSAIGVYRPDAPTLKLQVVAFGDAIPAVQNQIRVGLFSVQRDDGEAYTPMAAQTGYLLTQRASTQNSLTVSGADEQGLAKATAFALRRDYLASADTDSLTVATAPEETAPRAPLNDNGYSRLTDFGYDTITLAGAFHQEASFTLGQPNAMQSGALSYVRIHFRHSQTLVSDQSLLTVSIDGNPVGSVKLTPANANDGNLRVIIPAEALARQDINLRVTVYNDLGPVDSTRDYSDTAWTVVEGDSEVYFEPGDQLIRPTLAHFPQYPVTDAATDAVMVLPDAADSRDLTIAAALAMRAGQINGYAPRWAIAASAAPPEQPQGHLLFFGQVDRVSLPSAIRDALPIAPDQNGGLTVRQGLSIAAETLQNKIIAQVIRSPWNQAKRVYVLLYAPGMAQDALRLVETAGALAQLDGHVSLIDAAGQVTPLTVYTQQDALENVPLTVARLRFLWEQATGYPVWVLFVLLGIALLTVLLVIRLARNKAHLGQAAAKAGYKPLPQKPEHRTDHGGKPQGGSRA